MKNGLMSLVICLYLFLICPSSSMRRHLYLPSHYAYV